MQSLAPAAKRYINPETPRRLAPMRALCVLFDLAAVVHEEGANRMDPQMTFSGMSCSETDGRTGKATAGERERYPLARKSASFIICSALDS